jgi:hypothetical protein
MALLRILLSLSTKNHIFNCRYRIRLLFDCDVTLGQVFNASIATCAVRSFLSHIYNCVVNFLMTFCCMQNERVHGFWTFGRDSCNSLCLHGGLVQRYKQGIAWLARVDGTSLHSRRNVLCIENTRTLVPWQI